MSIFRVNSRLSVLLEEVAAVSLTYATVEITLRSGRVERAEFLYGNGRGNEVDARAKHKELLAAWEAENGPSG